MPNREQRKMKDVLRCPAKQKYYDENDIASIFRYAKGIEGKTLLTILQEAELTDEDIEWVRSKEADKGLPGKIVEASYFGYELNSRQEADFDQVGVELKTTAADMDSDTGRYKAGETISVTQINFSGPVEEDFAASHLYNKLKMLLVIFYYRNRTAASKLNYQVFFASLFEPTEEDFAIIKSDYRVIIEKIKNGVADTLSRSDGTYLSTAPKARRSTNLVSPFYGGVQIVKRGFTLRKEYVNVILSGYYTRTKPAQEEHLITDIHELEKLSVAEIIQGRFQRFVGKDIYDIASLVGIQLDNEKMNKATIAVLTARMLRLKSLRSEEFSKSGIVVKTICFDSCGNNREQFRLGDVDFMEIYNTPNDYVSFETDDDGTEQEVTCSGWEESELYAQLDSLKYLLVVFRKSDDGCYIFKGSKLWAMSDEDIELAHQDWLDVKSIITEGVQLTIGPDGRTYNNFPGVADARRIHLRPHGKKAYYVNADGTSWGNGSIHDTEILPDGRRMTRQSYWLSSNFVKNVVSELVDNH